MIDFEPETCPESSPKPARKQSTRHASTSNGVDKAIRRPRKPNQRESDSAPAGIEFWKTVPRDPGHCRCFRKTAARGCWPTPRSSAPSGRNYVCAGQNSGKLQGAPNLALDFSQTAGKASAMSRSPVRRQPSIGENAAPYPSSADKEAIGRGSLSSLG